MATDEEYADRLRDIDRLLGRIAEVEAERDRLVSLGKQAEQHEAWMNTRLAEVEAERDHLKMLCTHVQESNGRAWQRVEAAEDRLAAVEGLCESPDFVRMGIRAVTVERIRAVARGEGDRPAATCGHPCPGYSDGTVVDGCRIHGGEGDRPAGRPHEFTEDVADASMCICGIPGYPHHPIHGGDRP